MKLKTVRAHALVSALVVMLLLVVGTGAAGGADRAASVSATFSLRLKSRVDDGWKTWGINVDLSRRLHLYPRSYVYPSSWAATVDGCASSGQLTRYRWELRFLGGKELPVRVDSATCSSTVSLPRLGRWRVALTVVAADGTLDRSDRVLLLRDALVVSLGDSLSSGEGNPDEPRQFLGNNIIPAKWSDKQCHRSAKSWSARVARAAESATTSVTFLNFACSGAKPAHLTTDKYDGIDSGAGTLAPPQFEALRRTIGFPFDADTRRVDVLLLSNGPNELGFGDLLTSCATTEGYCPDGYYADPVRAGLQRLPASLKRINAAISTFANVASVYAVEYPSRLFTDGSDRHGGCGAFNAGMRSGEAHWITDRGDDMNEIIRTSSENHGWTYIGGVRDAFRKHGYCASNTWFRSYSGSKKLQGNVQGTAHPNPDGQQAIADKAIPLVRTDAPLLSRDRVLIQIISIRINDNRLGRHKECTDCYRVQLGILGKPSTVVTGPNNGEFPRGRTYATNKLLSAETNGTALELSATTKLPALWGGRVSGSGGRNVQILSPATYLRRAEGWETGRHFLRQSGDGFSLTVQYEVRRGPSTKPRANP